ncbi:MAG: DUF255 domain-containing protein [Candidatus Competibacteraceae bacterium]|nr:DUF255 domain-containing protein [Candidatus Competibacteraceae bacterium]
MKKILLFLAILTGGTQLALHAQSDVKWKTLEQAEKANKENKKKFFIDVYTDWCGWCKVMDQQTFQHPVISEILNTYFHPVKLDAEQKTPIVFNGKTYNFVASGRNGYNELAAEMLQGKLSYPTIVYLDENLGMIQPIAGFMKPAEIEPILMYFATDSYKTIEWPVYMQSFKSTLK